MERLISQYIPYENIEESKISLSMVCTDISNGNKVVLDKGNVAKSIMASTCVPGIFKPIDIDNKMLVDGGIVENVPVKTVRKMGAEFIIAVDLDPIYSHGKPNNIIDVILNSFHYSIRQTVAEQIKDADIIVNPDLSKFSVSSFKNLKGLIEKGYEEANKLFESLFSVQNV